MLGELGMPWDFLSLDWGFRGNLDVLENTWTIGLTGSTPGAAQLEIHQEFLSPLLIFKHF